METGGKELCRGRGTAPSGPCRGVLKRSRRGGLGRGGARTP